MPGVRSVVCGKQISLRRTISNHIGVMMDLDPSDNVIALGYGSAALTRKYDRDGTLLWERPYPTPDERALPSWISADLSGNTYVSAYLLTGTSSPSGWVVIKYDAQGNLLWKDTMPVAHGRTVRLETDSAGNAYVIGTMFLGNSSGSATLDAVTIKYAPNGVRQWTRVFNGGPYADDVPNSIALSPDGSRIAVVGATVGTFFTVVYDAQGNQLGQNLQPDFYEARDAAFGPQNNLYVGTARWTPETSNQMTVVKFNGNGSLVWIRSYADGDFVHRIAVDSLGNVVAAGVDQATTGMPYLDWVTLKLRPDGVRLWSQKYDGHQDNDERPFSLALDPSPKPQPRRPPCRRLRRPA